MGKHIQFDGFEDSKRLDSKANPHCIACEAMLTDAVDNTLGTAEQTWFNQHIASCVPCSETFADAQRGSAWLEMLKSPRPEPAADLMERILAQTTGQAGVDPAASNIQEFPAVTAATVPFIPPMAAINDNLIAFHPSFRPAKPSGMRTFGRVLLEPRLAMTAAMAFFSIALTLSLTGVRLNQLNVGNLKPSNVRRTYYQASTRAVQYYDNLRVVHVLESRVDDLKQANQDRELRQRTNGGSPSGPGLQQPPDHPDRQEQKPQKSEPGPGTSRRENPGETRGTLVGQNAISSNERLLAAIWPWNVTGGPA